MLCKYISVLASICTIAQVGRRRSGSISLGPRVTSIDSTLPAETRIIYMYSFPGSHQISLCPDQANRSCDDIHVCCQTRTDAARFLPLMSGSPQSMTGRVAIEKRKPSGQPCRQMGLQHARYFEYFYLRDSKEAIRQGDHASAKGALLQAPYCISSRT